MKNLRNENKTPHRETGKRNSVKKPKTKLTHPSIKSPQKRQLVKIKSSTSIEEFLQILHAAGDVFEIRSVRCPIGINKTFRSTESGYFSNIIEAIEAVNGLEARKPPAVYVTLNPVFSSLLARASNRMKSSANHTTTDGEIEHRRWLMIDIDPVRPSGISATEEEHKAALELTRAIRKELTGQGWPEPLFCLSGNGCYLLYRIDFPNDDASKNLVEDVLKSLASRFNTEKVKVDTATSNASRLIKIMGTTARKGDPVPGRPHRKSKFYPPSQPLKVVSEDLLRGLAASVPASPTKKRDLTNSRESGFVLRTRASNYLKKMTPAMAGEKGHNSLLIAATAMVRGFNLSDEAAFQLLWKEYNPRCQPHWSKSEINHKIAEARKAGSKDFGYLLESTITEEGEWTEPIPIEAPPLPIFPVEQLPNRIKKFVEVVAHGYQVPIELVALLVLAAISGMAARRVEILGRENWKEPIQLFVACLLESGNRKSAIVDLVFAPIREIEKHKKESMKPSVAASNNQLEVLQGRLKQAQKKAFSGNKQTMQLSDQLAIEIANFEQVVSPKLLMDNASPEAVENELAKQGGCMILYGAEGGLFDIMGGLYNKGKANLDVFLRGHAGEDHTVNRVSREAVIPKACLTLGYAVQPQVIRSISQNPNMRRGLLYRFLWAVPKSPLGNRQIEPAPVSKQVLDKYCQIFWLLESKFRSTDLNDLKTIKLTEIASKSMVKWLSEIEVMFRSEGKLADFKEWGGKLGGLTARIAGILHLVINLEKAELPPIPAPTIERAIAIARWAIPHAIAVLSMTHTLNWDQDDATHVLSFVKKRGKLTVSRREIHVNARHRFDGNKQRLDNALELLVDYGWIRPVPREKRVGRPSDQYSVNPALFDQNGSDDHPEEVPQK